MVNEENKETTFAPKIRTRDGKTITPTGNEWILFFALGGCQWAIDILKDKEVVFK